MMSSLEIRDIDLTTLDLPKLFGELADDGQPLKRPNIRNPFFESREEFNGGYLVKYIPDKKGETDYIPTRIEWFDQDSQLTRRAIRREEDGSYLVEEDFITDHSGELRPQYEYEIQQKDGIQMAVKSKRHNQFEVIKGKKYIKREIEITNNDEGKLGASKITDYQYDADGRISASGSSKIVFLQDGATIYKTEKTTDKYKSPGNKSGSVTETVTIHPNGQSETYLGHPITYRSERETATFEIIPPINTDGTRYITITERYASADASGAPIRITGRGEVYRRAGNSISLEQDTEVYSHDGQTDEVIIITRRDNSGRITGVREIRFTKIGDKVTASDIETRYKYPMGQRPKRVIIVPGQSVQEIRYQEYVGSMEEFDITSESWLDEENPAIDLTNTLPEIAGIFDIKI